MSKLSTQKKEKAEAPRDPDQGRHVLFLSNFWDMERMRRFYFGDLVRSNNYVIALVKTWRTFFQSASVPNDSAVLDSNHSTIDRDPSTLLWSKLHTDSVSVMQWLTDGSRSSCHVKIVP